MHPFALPPEVALRRATRSSIAILGVSLIVLLATLSVGPVPAGFVVAQFLLGLVVGFVLCGESSGASGPSRRMFVGILLLVGGSGILRSMLLGSASEEGNAEFAARLAAVMAGASLVLFLDRHRVVERRRRWWETHGAELSAGLGPEPTTRAERRRRRHAVEWRAMGRLGRGVYPAAGSLAIVLALAAVREEPWMAAGFAVFGVAAFVAHAYMRRVGRSGTS